MVTSYLLLRTRTCVNQGIRNENFSENFTYVLNELFVYAAQTFKEILDYFFFVFTKEEVI